MGFSFRATPLLRYSKNDRTKKFGNPSRRWLYHYIFAGVCTASAAYLGLQYKLADWESKKKDEATSRRMCSASLMDLFSLLPSNRISNMVGQLTEPGILPASAHKVAIEWLAWYYGIDLSDSAKQHPDEFESLQEFYTRRWRAECRPVDQAARVVSPCDGIVMSVQENITGNSLVQVKGLTYGIHSLFQVAPDAVPEGFKRVAVVVRLRMKDFHHVVAPTTFKCNGTVYVPGPLLPVSVASFHWLPSILSQNERLVVHGTTAADSAAAPPQPTRVFMALVGSTLMGKMRVTFDPRIRTNFLDPPEYAVHTSYKAQPLIRRGSDVGNFAWGSSVVLMMDVPSTAQLIPQRGDVLKAGEALVR